MFSILPGHSRPLKPRTSARGLVSMTQYHGMLYSTNTTHRIVGPRSATHVCHACDQNGPGMQLKKGTTGPEGIEGGAQVGRGSRIHDSVTLPLSSRCINNIYDLSYHHKYPDVSVSGHY